MPGPGPTFKGYSLCYLYSLGGMTFSQLLNMSATPLLWFDMFLAAIYINTLWSMTFLPLAMKTFCLFYFS